MKYKNLMDNIAKAGFIKKEIADVIGVNLKTFYNKLNGVTKFNNDEMLLIQKAINERLKTEYTIDYLFKKFTIAYIEEN